MTSILKSTSAYKTIGEVAKELDLVNNKNGSLQTHTLRFWEKQFRQIRPSIKAGKRRYYSKKDFETIKLIKYLLKDQGLTIKGVQKILNTKKDLHLDDSLFFGVNSQNCKNSKLLKSKIIKIAKIIKEIKTIKNG
tara:strand:- start:91 stop:495 length:405 start_codon:yes stop_codon:yes gene_type:complete